MTFQVTQLNDRKWAVEGGYTIRKFATLVNGEEVHVGFEASRDSDNRDLCVSGDLENCLENLTGMILTGLA